jgi:3-hydroxy acid dehydrogenase/malonic semialdehyde reductase
LKPEVSCVETALVTGATSGIGYAIAVALARTGRRVLAVGRQVDALARLADIANIEPTPLDILDRFALENRIRDEPIDILVNNAGIMTPLAPFDEATIESIDAAIAVNLTASVFLTRLVAPGMRARQRGHIFFTGSTAGHTAFPRLAIYGATKAAIGAFADGLRLDMAPYGVRVTEIVAGRTETNLYQSMLSDEARAAMYAGGTAVQPRDIANMMLAALALPGTANVSRFDIVPTHQATATGAAKKDD